MQSQQPINQRSFIVKDKDDAIVKVVIAGSLEQVIADVDRQFPATGDDYYAIFDGEYDAIAAVAWTYYINAHSRDWEYGGDYRYER